MSRLGQFLQNKKYLKWSLFCFAFLLYLNAIPNEYAQDDAIVITDNMYTQKGIEGIPSLFTTDAFYGFFKQDGKASLVQGGRYRPLSIVSFAVEESIFGGNPHISHTINALLYGILCFVLFLVFHLFLKVKVADQDALMIAFFASLFFTSLPVHVEVVANIKGRDELFVVLFGLVSSFFFFKENRNKVDLLWAYLFFGMAIFSKENAIVWLFLIPLSSWFFRSWQETTKDWIAMTPLLLIAAIFLWVRSSILGPGISEASMELMNNPFLKYEAGQMVPFSSSEKWGSIAFNLLKYFQLMVFPYPLTSDYYPYQLGIHKLTDPLSLISILFHLGLIFYAIVGFFKKHVVAYGIIFYFASLFLVSNIPFSIGTNISERFLFFPTVGISLSLAMLVFLILKRKFESRKQSAMSLIFIPICLVFAVVTIMRNPVWKDNFTLLTTDVKTSYKSAKALHGAAGALFDEAVSLEEGEKRNAMFQQSNEYLRQCLEVYPLYANAYLIQGNNFYYLKEYQKAVDSYNELIRLNPDHNQAFENLSLTLRDGGRYFGEQKGDLEKANDWLYQAYQMNPSDYETVRLLATSYGMKGDSEKALIYFKKARDLKPEEGFAWYNLANVYGILGQQDKYDECFQRAIELDPSIANRKNN